MTHLQALKTDALALPNSDQDDGVKEALRRDAELTEDSSSSVTWSDIKQQLGL